MNRDVLGPVLIALLTVVALGVGAATLDRVDPRSEAGDGGSSSGIGDGSEFVPADPSPIWRAGTFEFPLWLSGLLFGAVVAILLGLLYQFRDELSLEALRKAALALLPTTVFLMFVYISLQFFSSDNIDEGNGSAAERTPAIPGGSGDGSAMEEVSNAPLTDPPLFAITGLAGLVLLAGVAAVWLGRGGRGGWGTAAEFGLRDEDESAGSDATAELGHAAGRAADRIAAEGEATNEVYRAWREMTDQLDVANPQSSTPREFARAATDAGMERGDVDELTDLFRTVRYGGSRATDDRESRAVAALRNIEHEYAEES